MKKIIAIVLVVIGIVFLVTFTPVVDVLRQATTGPNTAIPVGNSSEDGSTNYTLQIVAENLSVPWAIEFTSPERILITERDGSIREVINGELKPDPLIQIQDVDQNDEAGLMGMVLDPEYETNKYLYVCYAYDEGAGLQDKIVRLIDEGEALTVDTTIIENIPAARYHAGCELAFGPDNKLYITTGDATNAQLAQNSDSLAGKILRINADGSIPEDNPLNNSPVFTLGHRNAQGMDWHPETGELYSVEHGPSGFDGPPGGDEINLLQAGENYGWPVVSHDRTNRQFADPLQVFTPAIAPASAEFYTGESIAEFENNLFVAMLRGEGLLRVQIDPETNEIISAERLPEIDVGRIREVKTGPEGDLYFTTSNTDGRGDAQPGDDKLYKLAPVEE